MFDISRENFLQFVNNSLDRADLSELRILRESGAEKIGFFRGSDSTRISQDIRQFVEKHFDEIWGLSRQQEENLTHNLAMLGLKKWDFQNVEVSENPGRISAIKKVAFSSLNNSENTVNETAAKLSEDLTKYVQNRCKRLLSFVLEEITDESQKESLRSIIQEIPPEQRTPTVIQSIAFLFNSTTYDYQKETILQAIQNIPPELRSDVIEKALPLLTGITDGLEREVILRAIQEIPGEQRSDFIEKVLPLLTGITDGSDKVDILLAVQKIPGEQRSDVIEKALPLLTGITDGSHKVVILRAVQKIPGEQRSDVIEKALPLLTGITDGYQKANILRAVQEIPAEQRSDVIEKALPLLTGITDGSHKVVILRAVQEIPAEQRSDVIEKALPLLTGITDGSHKVVILRAVQAIPPEQRSDFIEKVLPLLTGITYGFERAIILLAIQAIPGEQRSDVIEKALPLLTDITNGFERENILRTVQAIPGEQRSDVIEKALPLLTGITYGSHKVVILRAVQAIPGEQRSDIIEKALPLLTGITDGSHKAVILQGIQNIPPKLRSDVIEKALPLLTGITDGSHKVVILRAVQEIPPELRSDVIEKAPLFLESIENGDDRAAILKKLAAVSKEIQGDWLDLFSQIAKTRPPSLRHKLADLMLTCLHDGSAKQRFESPQFKTLFSREYMKPFRLLAALLWDEEEPDEELKAAAGVLSSSRYKDSEKKTIVLSSFIALFHTPLLATSQKKRCLGVIFPKDAINGIERKKIALANKNKDLKIALRKKGPDPSLQEKISFLRDEIKQLQEEIPQTEPALIDQINQSLSLMESIGNLGFFKNLEKMEKPEDLTHILIDLFKEITTVSDIENLLEKYLKTFGASRNPESLFIYAGKLKQLPEEMRAPALTCLKHYVEDVLNGDFFTSRYDEESSIHLKTVFQDNPELKPLWTEGTSVNLEEFCEEDPLSVSSSFDPKKYFMQRVLTDGHISQEKVPYLTAYLTDSNTPQEELSAEIQRVTEALERDPENVSLQEKLGILRLQRELISLLQSPSSREKLEIYSTGIKPLIEPALRGEEQFKRDLTDLESALSSQTKQRWTVVDTDDPIDLLLCGTDVIGSCQNIHGDLMNRCLVGYLSDGKNRLVAVKNEKGEIVGRSILRILWDPEQRRPVLFKERAYFKPPENKKVSDALDRMCVEKAKKLRLPLVAQVSEQPNVRPYPRPIVSMASRAPFEYSDAGGGATDGTFKVRGVLVADFSTENKRREDV